MSNVEQRRSRRTPDGTGAHLELTATDHGAPPTPHVEDLLVLYLSSRDEVDRLVAQAGAQRIPSANPYWDRPESPSWIPTDSG